MIGLVQKSTPTVRLRIGGDADAGFGIQLGWLILFRKFLPKSKQNRNLSVIILVRIFAVV
jgi:hypothetical protein